MFYRYRRCRRLLGDNNVESPYTGDEPLWFKSLLVLLPLMLRLLSAQTEWKREGKIMLLQSGDIALTIVNRNNNYSQFNCSFAWRVCGAVHKMNGSNKKKKDWKTFLPKNGDVGYSGVRSIDGSPVTFRGCCWMVVAGFCFGFWNGENAVLR